MTREQKIIDILNRLIPMTEKDSFLIKEAKELVEQLQALESEPEININTPFFGNSGAEIKPTVIDQVIEAFEPIQMGQNMVRSEPIAEGRDIRDNMTNTERVATCAEKRDYRECEIYGMAPNGCKDCNLFDEIIHKQWQDNQLSTKRV